MEFTVCVCYARSWKNNGKSKNKLGFLSKENGKKAQISKKILKFRS